MDAGGSFVNSWRRMERTTSSVHSVAGGHGVGRGGVAGSEHAAASVTAPPLGATRTAQGGHRRGVQQVHDQSPAAKDVLFETWAGARTIHFIRGSIRIRTPMQTDMLAEYDGAVWTRPRVWRGHRDGGDVGEAWRRDQFAADLYNGPE